MRGRLLLRGGSPGHTIVELIVVVGVIGVLSALIFGRVIRQIDAAHTTKGQDAAQEIRNAMMRYWVDESAWPPLPVTTLEDLQLALQEQLASRLPAPDFIQEPPGTLYEILPENTFRIRIRLVNRAQDILCITEKGVMNEVGGACP